MKKVFQLFLWCKGTFAGIKFRVKKKKKKKNAKLLTKAFANSVLSSYSREKNGANVGHLPKKLSRLKDTVLLQRRGRL